jgi:uncharacterized protein (DUF58 family)
MQVMHEIRPEFKRLSPAEIIKRLLRGAGSQSRRAGLQECSVTRQTASRGYNLADFRPYAPGDDTRFLDWRALARMDQPIIRLFDSADDHPQLILIDVSKSMDYGSPAKFSAACWAVMDAAVQCWTCGQRLGVDVMSAAGCLPMITPRKISGATGLIELVKSLSAIKPDGAINVDRSIAMSTARQTSSMRVTVISDFLPNAPTLLKGCRHTLNLLRVLSKTEVDPSKMLSHELVDIETGEKCFPGRDADSLDGYRQRLHDHGLAIVNLALSTGGFALDVRT